MKEINRVNIRKWAMLGQRGTIFGDAVPEIMQDYTNSYVVTADLGVLSGLDRVKNSYPDRYINVGIAEQNMIGVAAGLAFENNLVFATTYATFLAMRCYEQVRHNMGYQKANVKLVGSAAGFAMGMSGNTHYAYEDIAIMRVIPNMTVVAPADAAEAYMLTHQIAHMDGPVYMRLTGNLNQPIVYNTDWECKVGKGVVLKEGADVALVACGGCVKIAMDTADELLEKGVSVSVIDMHTIKPLDTDLIDHYLDVKLMVTVEEHSIIGGLGGAVAEHLAERSNHPKLLRIGVEDVFMHPNIYEKVLEGSGLTVEALTKKILGKIENER